MEMFPFHVCRITECYEDPISFSLLSIHRVNRQISSDSYHTSSSREREFLMPTAKTFLLAFSAQPTPSQPVTHKLANFSRTFFFGSLVASCAGLGLPQHFCETLSCSFSHNLEVDFMQLKHAETGICVRLSTRTRECGKRFYDSRESSPLSCARKIYRL